MQVKIEDRKNNNKLVWVSVQGSGLPKPYEYHTREAAERMLRICYGGNVSNDRLRVIEV